MKDFLEIPRVVWDEVYLVGPSAGTNRVLVPTKVGKSVNRIEILALIQSVQMGTLIKREW